MWENEKLAIAKCCYQESWIFRLNPNNGTKTGTGAKTFFFSFPGILGSGCCKLGSQTRPTSPTISPSYSLAATTNPTCSPTCSPTTTSPTTSPNASSRLPAWCLDDCFAQALVATVASVVHRSFKVVHISLDENGQLLEAAGPSATSCRKPETVSPWGFANNHPRQAVARAAFRRIFVNSCEKSFPRGPMLSIARSCSGGGGRRSSPRRTGPAT